MLAVRKSLLLTVSAVGTLQNLRENAKKEPISDVSRKS
jgi:hypothetical protein